jgi:hypothetical protein
MTQEAMADADLLAASNQTPSHGWEPLGSSGNLDPPVESSS